MSLPVSSAAVSEHMSSRHRLILVLLLGTQFMLSVDFSILNVALPAIGHGVGLSYGNLQWIATAFALPAAGCTLLFGRVADLTGRRRLFLGGVALLAASSLVGGLATTPTVLLTGRVLQGLATAIATPAALSVLVTTFPEGPLRQRALGLNGALLSAGFTAGALLGGVLTDLASWRWAFLVNVPVAVVILAVAPAVITEGRSGTRQRLDVPGAVTVTAGLLALVLGVAEGGNHGWARPLPLTALPLAVVLLVAFWFIELRSANPLAPVRVLRRRSVGWGNVGTLTVFSMESAMVFVMTLYLQQVLGYSSLATGLAFGVPGIVAFVMGVLAPRLIARIGSPRTLAAGLAVQGGLNLLLVLGGHSRSGIVLVTVVSAAVFAGHIAALVAATVTATSGLPNEQQGLATGLNTMTQQTAITLGIPVLSSIATARTAALGGGAPASDAVLGGLHLAVVVDAVVTVAVAALIAVFLRNRDVAPQASAPTDAVAATADVPAARRDAVPAAAAAARTVSGAGNG